MANQFSIQPANPLGGMQEAIGGYLELEAQKKQQGQQQALLEQASEIMRTGDASALVDFMVKNPDLREHMIATQGHISKQTRAGKVQVMKDILLGKPIEQTMQGQIELIRSEGGDPADAEAFLDPTMTDEERKQRALQGLAIYDPPAAKAYMETMGEGVSSKELAETAKLEAETKLLDQKFKKLGESGLDPEDKVNIEAGLRQEVFNRSKTFETVDDAFNRIQASAKEPSAAGDMAMIFNYMKILDPGSTVREGEYATAQQATGIPGRTMNLYNNIVDGMRLNDKQRADFLKRSKMLYGEATTKHTKLTDRYNTLATKYGVDPTNVILAEQQQQQQADEATETQQALTNAQGWQLMTDAAGNKAYVGPNGEIEEVQ